MLSKDQLKDVCMYGSGCNQCRYLDNDRTDTNKFVCKKKSPDATIIDEEIAEFISECKKTGDDPNDRGVALGDHCAGYLPLRDVLQGYDVP